MAGSWNAYLVFDPGPYAITPQESDWLVKIGERANRDAGEVVRLALYHGLKTLFDGQLGPYDFYNLMVAMDKESTDGNEKVG
jgi:hypothetical protein